MSGKILVAYSTKTGINEQAAKVIADAFKTTYKTDVTVVDLKAGSPDITAFQNIIVGGGVKSTSVYNEAVDFLEKDFGGRKVALYFCCEDQENPKEQSTEDNSKKVLAKNKSLKLIDVAAFGGCMLREGRPVMDDLNMNRVKEWAIELGRKFNIQAPAEKREPQNLLNTVPFEKAFQFFTELEENTGITANSTSEFAEKLQIVPIRSVTFHFQRQDFQNWFKSTVGDEELSKRIDQINLWVHNDENLRKELSKTVQNRITELTKSPIQISS
jgi:menaquinone-dependent protoporphyrinogen IX oxidase